MSNRPIGIFDSGIGGATIFKEILRILPNENYIYYSDSRNNPYGDKTKEEIYSIVKNIVDFFISKQCRVIVIACNTASAITVEKLRQEYKNIEFIATEPAYKMVYDNKKDGKTLVMATKGTIESEKFHLLYEKYNNNNTVLLACVGLADLIERQKTEEIEQYLYRELGQLKEIKNVVLGCTHYPLIKDKIEHVLGNVMFFDGSIGVANRLKAILEKNQMLTTKEGGGIIFYDSSESKEKEEFFFKIIMGYK